MIYFLLAAYFVISFLTTKYCDQFVGQIKNVDYLITTIIGLIWPIFFILVLFFVVKNYVTKST